MKKVLLAVLCATSTAGFADSTVFEGMAVDLSVGYQKTERDSASTATSIDGGVATKVSASSTSHDKSDAGVILGVSYNFALSSNYLLGVGFDYDFAEHKMGTPVFDNDPSDATTDWELSDAMSLYIKPQFMITDKSQFYAKLAYIRADVEMTDSTPDYVKSKSETVDGYSLGAGYANMITHNVSFFVEANYLNYGKEDVGAYYNGSPDYISLPSDISGYNAKIGIAYKF